ncbi:MAG TPA: tetratricopeptide repeat protein [Myxococcales bacterium]|nr:tetratricopeptide repeat protein [Myxococcales bacterium]
MTDPSTRRALDDGGLFEDDADAADNQEFDRALIEASDVLQRGDAGGARQLLEKALRFKPRNQRARNLLGLSLFKLGELEKAEAIYRGLIEDHPADPTLRVNLGLVFLKLGAALDAVRCFETTLDLSPDHSKAQNYLGIALAQNGDLAKAREWFLKAGNSAMAQRMEQQLAAAPLREVAERAGDSLEQAQPFRPATEEKPAAGRPSASSWVATAPAPGKAIGRLALGASSSAAAANEPPDVEEPSELAAYTTTRRLSIPNREGGFGIGSTEVVIQVRGEMLTRLDGLVASWGQLSLKPELKRFRGRPTDKPFGEGARRMLRASGEGRFVVSREGRVFTALELGDEPAYFREEVLFAFEESIVFENGRVPSKTGHDLHLVHVRGRGKLLLVTVGEPKAVELTRGEPLRIPMDQLVGWHGPLIQPRVVPIVEEAPELGVALELAGEGSALVDAPDGR